MRRFWPVLVLTVGVLTVGGWLLLRSIMGETRAFISFTDQLQKDLKANNGAPAVCGRANTDALKPELFVQWPELSAPFAEDDRLPPSDKQVIADAVTGGVDVIRDDSLWVVVRNHLGTSDLLRFLVTLLLTVGAYVFGNKVERSMDPQALVGNALTHAWKTFRQYARTSVRGIAIACTAFALSILVALHLARVDHRDKLVEKFVEI